MSQIILIAIFLLGLKSVHAMDIGTHDMLIEKIESGLQADQTPQIRLRLADLLSDRARLKALQENEKSCNNCHKSREDRTQALGLYLGIFDNLNGKEQLHSFEQIAQSYTVLNQKTNANRFYKKVINGKYSRTLKAQAHLKNADQLFFDHKYEVAYQDYKKAISLDSTTKFPLTRYRMAWCEFNQGQFEIAKRNLGAILESKEAIDSSLRSGMTGDYARFSAKGAIGRYQIQKLHQLSSQEEAKGNVELLANELDRLGRAHENILVNHYLLEVFETDPLEKAKAYLRLAQAELSLKRLSSVVVSFKKSTEFQKKVNCEKVKVGGCEDFNSKAKKFLVFWNQVEKDKPSAQLHQVWVLYLKLFPLDHEMHFMAAKSFHKGKNLTLAQTHYIQSAEIIHKQETKEMRRHLEASLDAAMACAEEIKQIEMKRVAYSSYLKLYPSGPKVLHAKYQIGFLDYQEKKYSSALQTFTQMIGEFKKAPQVKDSRQIAYKASHLILDIHAEAKDNKNLMSHALAFSQLFKAEQNEFNTIYRKALLNETVAVLKSKKPQQSWKEDLLNKYHVLNFKGVEKTEKSSLLEARLQLAKSLQNLDEVQQTAVLIIGQKDLMDSTRQLGFTEAVWAAEMKLNFGKAYEYAKMQKARSQDRNIADHLRLGLLAEMAGRNPKTHFEAALNNTRGTLESNRLRAKIVQTSPIPWKELVDRLGELRKSPLLLSELAMETFARYTNFIGARKVLDHWSVAKKPSGVRLQRQIDMPELKSLAQKIRPHQISKSSESRSQKDLVVRLDYINQIEEQTNKAVSRQDLVIQVAGLSLLSEQKSRLARELLQMPKPSGLQANEIAEYQKMLTNKAQQMDQEAKGIQEKVEHFWAQGTLVKQLRASMSEASYNLQKIIAGEVEFLKTFSMKKHHRLLADIGKIRAPDQKALQSSYAKLKAKPFDAKATRDVYEQEKAHNRTTQMAYYKHRLENLEKRILP